MLAFFVIHWLNTPNLSSNFSVAGQCDPAAKSLTTMSEQAIFLLPCTGGIGNSAIGKREPACHLAAAARLAYGAATQNGAACSWAAHGYNLVWLGTVARSKRARKLLGGEICLVLTR